MSDPVSHEARSLRRTAIVEAVRAVPEEERPALALELSRQHRLTPATVYLACRENGVWLARFQDSTTSAYGRNVPRFRILAAMIRSDADDASIGKQFGLSAERVRRIRVDGTTAGIFEAADSRGQRPGLV
jgi:hypothetical protein